MCGVIVPSILFQVYRCTGYYRPESGPHLERWVEYMITSPLQVVFVALAFHIRDVDLLVCLWALQFSMVLTGYSIEREIASLGTNSDRWKRAGLIVIFLTSVLVHFVIWSVIYARLRTEQGVVDACASAVFSGDASSSAAQLKTALDAVFWGQALLFSSFVIPPVWLWLQQESGPLTPDAWRRNAKIHSVLSVFTKNVLVYSFIFYASRLASIQPST